jgi:hypothetical protein
VCSIRADKTRRAACRPRSYAVPVVTAGSRGDKGPQLLLFASSGLLPLTTFHLDEYGFDALRAGAHSGANPGRPDGEQRIGNVAPRVGATVASHRPR